MLSSTAMYRNSVTHLDYMEVSDDVPCLHAMTPHVQQSLSMGGVRRLAATNNTIIKTCRALPPRHTAPAACRLTLSLHGRGST